jgi:hypothetical protein
MSGTASMLTLLETTDGMHPQSMRDAGGRSLPDWHRRLVEEISAHLTPTHAQLLAQPVRTAHGWSWCVPGRQQRRFADLSVAERRDLTRALGVMLSDIRRLGESGRAPSVAAVGRALFDVPDWDHVFAVDGRPALVAWGHLAPGQVSGGDGVLTRLDDGVRWRAPPLVPWSLYGWSAGAVALLALAVGLALPYAQRAFVPANAECVPASGQLALLRELNEAAGRNAELKELLSTTDDELGARALQCPIRQALAPAPPPPRPAPTPAPPPPAPTPLPADRWDRHDLAMLEGCWHNTADFTTYGDAGDRHEGRTWLICFDRSGNGHQTLTWNDDVTCKGRMSARFSDDGHLLLTDLERCAGRGRGMYKGEMKCQRISDSEADCKRTQDEGPGRGNSIDGRFKR